LLDYTQKTGETQAIKKIMRFIEQQVEVKDTIDKKLIEKEAYR